MASPFSISSPLVDSDLAAFNLKATPDEFVWDGAFVNSCAWSELSTSTSNPESFSTSWWKRFNAALDAAESESMAVISTVDEAETSIASTELPSAPSGSTSFASVEDELPCGPSIDTQLLWPSVELPAAGEIAGSSDDETITLLRDSHREESRADEWIHRRVSNRTRRERGPVETLPKDTDGYAHPLALYARLANLPKLATKTLDRLIVPPSDACTLSGSYRRCRFNRDLRDGQWIERDARCDVRVEGWESYRRHIIQMHLDLPRCDGVSQPEQIARRLHELSKKAAAANKASSSRPSMSGKKTQVNTTAGIRRKRDAEEEAKEAADERVGKRARRG